MIANNVNIEQLIEVLMTISNSGAELINIEVTPDDNHPSMNKLIVSPVVEKKVKNSKREVKRLGNGGEEIIIDNPNINPENNDIFDSLNDLM